MSARKGPVCPAGFQRKRDFGSLLFIDLRDHFGVTQVVVDVSRARSFKIARGCAKRERHDREGEVVAAPGDR